MASEPPKRVRIRDRDPWQRIVIDLLEQIQAAANSGNADTLNGQLPSFYLDRDNHTGSQLAATISDLATAVAALLNASPALGGVPTAPTAAAATNTTQIATTAFVQAAAAALVDSSPATLDTLNELAAALGDDPNFATTLATSLGGKQDADADLATIAGQANTAFGLALLLLADQAALLAATGAKADSMSSLRILGRKAAGAGVIQELLHGLHAPAAPFKISGNPRHYPPLGTDFGAATASLPADRLIFVLFASRVSISDIVFEVTTASAAGGLARLGLYAADGTTGHPGTLIEDLGTVAIDTTGNKVVPLSAAYEVMEPVWLAINASLAATIRGGTVNVSEGTRVYGSDIINAVPAAGVIAGLQVNPYAFAVMPTPAPAINGIIGSARMICARAT